MRTTMGQAITAGQGYSHVVIGLRYAAARSDARDPLGPWTHGSSKAFFVGYLLSPPLNLLAVGLASFNE